MVTLLFLLSKEIITYCKSQCRAAVKRERVQWATYLKAVTFACSLLAIFTGVTGKLAMLVSFKQDCEIVMFIVTWEISAILPSTRSSALTKAAPVSLCLSSTGTFSSDMLLVTQNQSHCT